MFKRINCLTAALLIALSAAGCKNNKEEKSVSESEPATVRQTEASSAAEMTDEPEQTSKGINPLTGEGGYNDAAFNKRPVAVMVNNLKGALPQYGIEQADIIYEIPVEGGITRLMAVYADYTNVPDVCSVRSCRYYYPLICLGMDAIYCHWGEDMTIALDTLNRTGIDHLDGGYEEKMFYRDPDRVGKYASEHTGYLKGSELPEMIAEKGFRTDLLDAYKGDAFNFAAKTVTPSEMTAETVSVHFSKAYYSTFKYDKKTGEYLKQHSGNSHIDGKTGNQLAFDNVIVLQTDIHTRDDNYLMDVALSGGTGYYFSHGGGQAVKWTKKGENDRIRLYDKDGKELSVNVGESYIAVIGAEKKITAE